MCLQANLLLLRVKAKPPDTSIMTSTTHILALPSEIRCNIFYYAVLPPEQTGAASYERRALVLSPARRNKLMQPPRTPDKLHPSLEYAALDFWGTRRMTQILRVCRQFHEEVRHILYSTITFGFWPSSADSFLNGVPDGRKFELLKHVVIFVPHIPLITGGYIGVAPSEVYESAIYGLRDERASFAKLRQNLPNLKTATCEINYPASQRGLRSPLHPFWTWKVQVRAILHIVAVFKGLNKVIVQHGPHAAYFLDELERSLVLDELERSLVLECNRRIQADEWDSPSIFVS